MTEPMPPHPGDTGPVGERRPPVRPHRRHTPRRVVLAGATLFGASAAAGASPLLWGRSDVNRYVVAFALVGACVGVSFVLHGAWDGLRGK